MSKSDYKLDLARIADLWTHGSVVRSRLLEVAASALKQDQDQSFAEKMLAALHNAFGGHSVRR